MRPVILYNINNDNNNDNDNNNSNNNNNNTVEPLVSGHPWDRLEVSAYEGCPLTGG